MKIAFGSARTAHVGTSSALRISAQLQGHPQAFSSVSGMLPASKGIFTCCIIFSGTCVLSLDYLCCTDLRYRESASCCPDFSQMWVDGAWYLVRSHVIVNDHMGPVARDLRRPCLS